MEKITSVRDLPVIIETTRRCNMWCDHCMRGASQPIDIDNKHMKALFSRIAPGYGIGFLGLTGGEPSLNPSAIAFIAAQAFPIGFVSIVSNGKDWSGEFKLAVNQLAAKCDYVKVAVSRDHFHEQVEPDQVGFDPRVCISNHYAGLSVIAKGRGKSLSIAKAEPAPYSPKVALYATGEVGISTREWEFDEPLTFPMSVRWKGDEPFSRELVEGIRALPNSVMIRHHHSSFCSSMHYREYRDMKAENFSEHLEVCAGNFQISYDHR